MKTMEENEKSCGLLLEEEQEQKRWKLEFFLSEKILLLLLSYH